MGEWHFTKGELMLPDFLGVHRRASTALDALSRAERDSLAAKFTALRGLPVEEWAREGVQQLNAPVHFVRLTANLLVFFSVLPEGRFLIQDFVRQETLDRFFASPHQEVAQT
jgi:hypothetical protein